MWKILVLSNKRVQTVISVLRRSADIPGSLLSSLKSQKPFSQLWQLHQLDAPLLEPSRPRRLIVLEGYMCRQTGACKL
jgi:hypothetical protein